MHYCFKRRVDDFDSLMCLFCSSSLQKKTDVRKNMKESDYIHFDRLLADTQSPFLFFFADVYYWARFNCVIANNGTYLC